MSERPAKRPVDARARIRRDLDKLTEKPVEPVPGQLPLFGEEPER